MLIRVSTSFIHTTLAVSEDSLQGGLVPIRTQNVYPGAGTEEVNRPIH